MKYKCDINHILYQKNQYHIKTKIYGAHLHALHTRACQADHSCWDNTGNLSPQSVPTTQGPSGMSQGSTPPALCLLAYVPGVAPWHTLNSPFNNNKSVYQHLKLVHVLLMKHVTLNI
jgi:hypothetical protein